MSSFAGKLRVTGTRQGDYGEYDVINCRYLAGHEVDRWGRVTAPMRNAGLELEVTASPSCIKFFSALCTHEELSEATVIFNRQDQDSMFMQIKIEHGACYSYEQVFNEHESHPMVVRIKLSAGTISFDGEGGISSTHIFNANN